MLKKALILLDSLYIFNDLSPDLPLIEFDFLMCDSPYNTLVLRYVLLIDSRLDISESFLQGP